MRRVWWLFALVGISIGFLSLLCYYGNTFLPTSPDESVFIQPAQNLAEGKGMGTPMLGDLLPGIARRTYWQPPVYFLALSIWGRLFGFDLLSARWFSRLLGILGLMMLFALARKWGLPSGVSLLCVLWTALDLHYQYNANIARMDMLNLIFLLASLLAFTEGLKGDKDHAFFLSGIFATLATLTHLISVPLAFSLLIYLSLRCSTKKAIYFGLPLLLGFSVWFVYALQDWTAFIGQMALQFQRKGEGGLDALMLRLLFIASLIPIWGVFPVNSPPIWLGLICVTVIALKRRISPLTDWQVFVIATAYLAAAIGGESWYVGWFVPLGYLMTGLWSNAFLERQRLANSQWLMEQKLRMVLLAIALLWLGYQAMRVGQNFTGMSVMQRDIARFMDELPRLLPFKSTVLLHSIPDPYLTLRHHRPDLHLYQISPTPMQPKALQRLKRRADFFIGVWEWASGRLSEPDHLKGLSWTMRAPSGAYRLWLVSLSPDRHQTYPHVNAKGFKGARP